MSNNGKGSNNGKLIGYCMIKVEMKDLDCLRNALVLLHFYQNHALVLIPLLHYTILYKIADLDNGHLPS